MGQHTWFRKDKKNKVILDNLHDQIDKHDNSEIWLDDLELLQINAEIDKIYEENDTEFHDLFRSWKRNKDGTYTDDVIYSQKECNKWLEDNKEVVKIHNKNLLNEFWEKYPDGYIEF